MAMLNNQMVADVADTTAACDISPVGSCWTILCQARWPERPERRVPVVAKPTAARSKMEPTVANL
jgi:hypothetical protein